MKIELNQWTGVRGISYNSFKFVAESVPDKIALSECYEGEEVSGDIVADNYATRGLLLELYLNLEGEGNSGNSKKEGAFGYICQLIFCLHSLWD